MMFSVSLSLFQGFHDPVTLTDTKVGSTGSLDTAVLNSKMGAVRAGGHRILASPERICAVQKRVTVTAASAPVNTAKPMAA